MGFGEIESGIKEYKKITKETMLPDGTRRISFPTNWHKHNGRDTDGQSPAPRFALHGLQIVEIEITPCHLGETPVYSHKLFRGS